jgi:HAD superfamily hydrolase (TIGR01549 family)
VKNIQNIIFDLGGVIIDLDIDSTIAAMNQIGHVPFDRYYTQSKQTDLFNDLDTGKISPDKFFKLLKKEINFRGRDHELVDAWNAMLLDVPDKRLDVLVKAKQNYNTFLLSNTNEPHIEVFERDLYNIHGVKNFEDYFDKVYYSCRVGLRKPNKEIFELVLKENDLDPAETVFIDDSIQHVQGAGECGIKAYLLNKNMEVGDLLKQLKLF